MAGIFDGKETLELIKLRAEDEAYRKWKPTRPDEGRYFFTKLIWERVTWAKWYLCGTIDGAIFLNSIEHMTEKCLGEAQCLQHHFCVQRELSLEQTP
jgi:hypothetical protein